MFNYSGLKGLKLPAGAVTRIAVMPQRPWPHLLVVVPAGVEASDALLSAPAWNEKGHLNPAQCQAWGSQKLREHAAGYLSRSRVVTFAFEDLGEALTAQRALACGAAS